VAIRTADYRLKVERSFKMSAGIEYILGLKGHGERGEELNKGLNKKSG
jgi:hypothetical protein